jgi:hypothetical protein
MRCGSQVLAGEHLHVDNIEMCRRGLHASMTKADAKQYAPVGAVLTRVKVWGRIRFEKDKLVATDRMIIGEIDHGES